MCMANSHWYPVFNCFFKGEIPQFGHVGMKNPIFRMVIEERFQQLLIFKQVLWINRAHSEYPSFHGFYFIVIGSPFLTVYHEIELYLAFVYSTIVIHDHGFCPSPVHDGKEIQYPDGFVHFIFNFWLDCTLYFVSRYNKQPGRMASMVKPGKGDSAMKCVFLDRMELDT